jgi:cytochrome c-type biogenesis protein CcmH/NrfG
MTAIAVAVIARYARQRLGVAGFIVVFSLAGYLHLGQPDARDFPAARDDAAALRHLQLLAARPMEILTQENPNDTAALAVMADISLRMGKPDAARDFYARAIAAAGDDDIRATQYRRLMDEIVKENKR